MEKKIVLTMSKMLSCPQFPEDPIQKVVTNRAGFGFTLPLFVQLDSSKEKWRPALERHYQGYLPELNRSERTRLSMHLIWCHQVILDKIFECMEQHKSVDENTQLILLLFDMLYLFSETGKIL